jgi:light-regulated signal transduction histidine kinase (bacteriophytochrome)
MVNIYTELLMKRYVPPEREARDYAALVRQGVTKMEMLIRDVLSYAKAVREDEAPAGSADLAMALQEALAVLDASLEESGAKVICEQLPVVRGETNQLASVFQNLLSNALKYRKDDVPPEIRVSAERDGEHWIVAVKDNGIGFDQKYAERDLRFIQEIALGRLPWYGAGSGDL